MNLRSLALTFVLLNSAYSFGQSKPGPLSDAEGDAALRQAWKIKPGMTMHQAWKEIGLGDRYRAVRLGRGSGPSTRFGLNYELTKIHRLYVEVNGELNPPRVVSAKPVWLGRGTWAKKGPTKTKGPSPASDRVP